MLLSSSFKAHFKKYAQNDQERKRERDVIIQRKVCACIGERQKITSKGNKETEKEKRCKRNKVEEKKNFG